MYDDLGLFQLFFLGGGEGGDALRSLWRLMICSTSHRQREVHLLLLVAGAVLACFTVLL